MVAFSQWTMVAIVCDKSGYMQAMLFTTHNSVGAEMWCLEMRQAGLRPDVVTYTALIGACARANDVAVAERWLQELLEADDVAKDNVSFCMTVDACARAGEVARAKHWLRQVEEAGLPATHICLGTLMHAFAKAGDVPGAEKAIEAVPGRRRAQHPDVQCAHQCWRQARRHQTSRALIVPHGQ